MPPADEPSGGVTLTLTAAERAFLQRALLRYRRTVKSYLRSGQEELALLDGILRRLDGEGGG